VGGLSKRRKGSTGGADLRRCPLCGKRVAGGEGEAAAALNRHFGTDCTWRHTSPSPARPSRGK
jgi:hypothetical protein